MNEKHEQLWYAYVDGELSVTEMAEFEKSLTPADRDRLAGEMRFENGLSERLNENATCPIKVWERTKALLKQAQAKEKSSTPDNIVPMTLEKQEAPRRSLFWGTATIVAAACVALAVMYTPGTMQDEESRVVILAAESVEELAAQSEIGGNIDDLHQYLADHGMELGLNDIDSLRIATMHYGIEVLGAMEDMIGSDPVIEMLFSCCNSPVKVIMTKQDSAAAQYIGRAAGRGNTQIQATRIIHGEYLAAVVGTHPAHGLLDIFAGQHP